MFKLNHGLADFKLYSAPGVWQPSKVKIGKCPKMAIWIWTRPITCVIYIIHKHAAWRVYISFCPARDKMHRYFPSAQHEGCISYKPECEARGFIWNISWELSVYVLYIIRVWDIAKVLRDYHNPLAISRKSILYMYKSHWTQPTASFIVISHNFMAMNRLNSNQGLITLF